MTDLMVANNSKTLNWDGRQLNSLSYYCGGMSFKYNDQGIRTYKSIGGCSGGYAVSYVLDGSRILSETKGTATIYYTYDADGTLVSMNYNGNEYFYITNMQGDVVELVDISGTTVVKYKYDAWGNIIYQTPNQPIGNINPFRYRSYYFDTETGWYYLQSRYYNPSIGRFISSDGLLGKTESVSSQNTFAYCENNPIMRIDPTGELWITIVVVTLLLFSVFSTSPQLQDAVAEVTTVTNLGGSITTGSFAFGKAVWSKSIYVAINQQGKVNDIYGHTIENIKSCLVIDAGIPYYEHYLNDAGEHTNILGVSVAGFFTQIGWGEDGFRIDGGLAINFKYGAGFFGNSKTIEFNILGYLYDKLSD